MKTALTVILVTWVALQSAALAAVLTGRPLLGWLAEAGALLVAGALWSVGYSARANVARQDPPRKGTPR